jgi:hypothetical protein
VGRVVLVLDRHLGRELALKLLHDAPSSRADLESFQREFELLSKIEHPAVARAHDFGCIDELPYFTCEFVPGPTLASLTRIVDPARIARIALDLTGALAFLHRNGILHLDVKPSNVIVPAEASRPGAVLVDFGIFRRGGATFQGGKVQGSLPYMGPERFQEVKLQPSTDVYALGVTFYRVLTGAFPRAGATDGDPRLTNESAWRPLPPAPSELGSRASALDGWILKCLALDPAARYASAVEALEDLERACEVHGLSSRATAPAATIVRLVGREEELRQGERFLERVGQRAASPVLLLTGPPGAGQTALLRELKVVAQTRKVRFYLETGYPGGGGSPGGLFSRSRHASWPRGIRAAPAMGEFPRESGAAAPLGSARGFRGGKEATACG